jgi:hypothetical protein
LGYREVSRTSGTRSEKTVLSRTSPRSIMQQYIGSENSEEQEEFDLSIDKEETKEDIEFKEDKEKTKQNKDWKTVKRAKDREKRMNARKRTKQRLTMYK